MSLNYAMLGWLSTGPGSGYDLAKHMNFRLSRFWGAAHSQIYPRLKELEAKGLITSESVTVGSKLEKRVYTITDEGRSAVRQWASEPPTYPPNRDNERLRLIFSDRSAPRHLIRHFEAHLARHEAQLKHLEDLIEVLDGRHSSPREQRSQITNGSAPAEDDLTVTIREMAHKGDVHRAQLEIDWAKACLGWLHEFQMRHATAGGSGQTAGQLSARRGSSRADRSPDGDSSSGRPAAGTDPIEAYDDLVASGLGGKSALRESCK